MFHVVTRSADLDALGDAVVRRSAVSITVHFRWRGALRLDRSATSAAPTAASNANVPAPGSWIAAATRSTKIDATVTPGTSPMTVPRRKSRQRMCDAPATILTTENGPTGT